MTTKSQIDQFITDHKAELIGMVEHCYAIDPMAEVGRGIDREMNLHPSEWSEILVERDFLHNRWTVRPFGTLFSAYWQLFKGQYQNYVHVHPATLPGASPRDKEITRDLGGDFFLTLWGTGIGRYICTSILDQESGAWTDETRVLE